MSILTDTELEIKRLQKRRAECIIYRNEWIKTVESMDTDIAFLCKKIEMLQQPVGIKEAV